MRTLRIVQYGVGAMGSNMVKLLQSKSAVRIVGAIDHDPAKVGKDLSEVSDLNKPMGIKIAYPPENVLDDGPIDVVLHATTAFLKDAYPQILAILERRANVITICQELFFPLGRNREMAMEIDRKAREMGVGVTAVGINPGFVMDIVPIVCSVPCWEVKRVFVRRVVDFSPYGPDEMRHIGAGISPQEFLEGVKQGIIGHIGLLETAAMVAHCLGLPVDELRQTKEPVITRKQRASRFITIAPGSVCGFRQNVAGLRNGETLLDFRMVGIVCPDSEEDGVTLGDYTRIEGTPNVDITIKEEIAQKGGMGTAAVAVNMIPRILNAPPGFHTMNTLALPYIWNGGLEPPPIQKITTSFLVL
ncbi:MAG: NADP-binding protein [Candidatus Sumerlaeota bacterium]|nr:NADP-binding protein [Candidatus Sumerlaeota bacterium]